MQDICRSGYILILILSSALLAGFVWHPALPNRFSGLTSIKIPDSIDGYTGKIESLDPVVIKALNSASIVADEYARPDGNQVELVLIGGTDRSALHDPRSCLVGSGWRIDNDHVESVQTSNGSIPIRSCIATVDSTNQGEQNPLDIVYLYIMNGKVIASATQIRASLLESALLEQNDQPVYFIRFVSPINNNEDHVACHQRLISFAAAMCAALVPQLMRGRR